MLVPPFSTFFVYATDIYNVYTLDVHYLLDIGEILSSFSTGFAYTLDIHMVYERFSVELLLQRYRYTSVLHRYTAPDTGYTFPLMVFYVIVHVQPSYNWYTSLFFWCTLRLLLQINRLSLYYILIRIQGMTCSIEHKKHFYTVPGPHGRLPSGGTPL